MFEVRATRDPRLHTAIVTEQRDVTLAPLQEAKNRLHEVHQCRVLAIVRAAGVRLGAQRQAGRLLFRRGVQLPQDIVAEDADDPLRRAMVMKQPPVKRVERRAAILREDAPLVVPPDPHKVDGDGDRAD